MKGDVEEKNWARGGWVYIPFTWALSCWKSEVVRVEMECKQVSSRREGSPLHSVSPDGQMVQVKPDTSELLVPEKSYFPRPIPSSSTVLIDALASWESTGFTETPVLTLFLSLSVSPKSGLVGLCRA